MNERNTQLTQAEALGTWQTGTLETELGPAHIVITFEEERLEVRVYFEGAAPGAENRSEGPYEFRDGWLYTPVLFKGRGLAVCREDDELVFYPPDEDEVRAFRRS